jgi:hypothetical protein
MNKSTRVIEVIEMTMEEELRLWRDYNNWEKHGILDWDMDDGRNEIRLESENFYRSVCIVD